MSLVSLPFKIKYSTTGRNPKKTLSKPKKIYIGFSFKNKEPVIKQVLYRDKCKYFY
jgi:hypothetical protein